MSSGRRRFRELVRPRAVAFGLTPREEDVNLEELEQ